MFFFLLVCTASFAQQSPDSQPSIDTLPYVDASPERFVYDDDLLSKSFHAGRRQALRDLMPNNSVAVFFASPVRNRSNDVDFEYHQDPNFFYFSGLQEPHSMLLIFKEEVQYDGDSINEIIFIQPRDPSKELWNGRRLGEEGVKRILGFDKVLLNEAFADFNIDFSAYSQLLYSTPLDDIRDNPTSKGDLYSLVKHFEQKVSTKLTPENELMLDEMVAKLRQIKLTDELTLMINAIDFTCAAQRELMKALKPGMNEYEAEALIEYVFMKNGAEHPGFPSILGGGENSCILHYVSNRRELKAGDLLVCDIGAEYHNYTADVTRTLPVSGKFTEEQALIYNIVLEAQQAGINACKEGNKFWAPGNEAKRIITKRLLELEIIATPTEMKLYFMHGTSHYLGLDVHDVGLYGPLKRGNVITVEPGIYIPEGSPCDPKWWNIGVRIEDDVLITDDVPEVLSSCVPKTIAVIEALMKEKSLITR
ncbi:MAG: aminopeptidase P N-terminal domain-containing protein [Flavobacteriales bacterium]|nr:aminopeptidase P N-terminal domain-containing protein [Flavobacteriales bacterium]